jgi:peptidoglycan hydrolase-like protein with peptidoglycan-binding domain
MGRFGPAFLAYDNFRVYLQWNNALVYSTTAAYLATRIAGAPPLHRDNAPPPLAFADVKVLQESLVRAGYDVGAIDGFLGLKTRQAVKAMQLKYTLPPDSYPTAELLAQHAGRPLMHVALKRPFRGKDRAQRTTWSEMLKQFHGRCPHRDIML